VIAGRIKQTALEEELRVVREQLKSNADILGSVDFAKRAERGKVEPLGGVDDGVDTAKQLDLVTNWKNFVTELRLK